MRQLCKCAVFEHFFHGLGKQDKRIRIATGAIVPLGTPETRLHQSGNISYLSSISVPGIRLNYYRY